MRFLSLNQTHDLNYIQCTRCGNRTRISSLRGWRTDRLYEPSKLDVWNRTRRRCLTFPQSSKPFRSTNGMSVLRTGLEPVVSTLKGWRGNQLLHRSVLFQSLMGHGGRTTSSVRDRTVCYHYTRSHFARTYVPSELLHFSLRFHSPSRSRSMQPHRASSLPSESNQCYRSTKAMYYHYTREALLVGSLVGVEPTLSGSTIQRSAD